MFSKKLQSKLYETTFFLRSHLTIKIKRKNFFHIFIVQIWIKNDCVL